MLKTIFLDRTSFFYNLKYMKKVLLSGMQPTGMLHLGNYEGALKNFVELQNSGKYDCYYCIVDWHALTSIYAKPDELQHNIYELLADYLSSGLDPQKSTIFLQSSVKEHAELHLLLSMITPTAWLERVPSYKEKSVELGLDSYGFLGYPLLQAADILVYRADVVPVGKDQLPHIELTREIARRFNFLYGEIFPEPQEILTKFPIVPGTDGRKMSKSYNNYISMGEEPENIRKKILSMFTDPEKIYKGDPGHPDRCPVYLLHQIYNPEYIKIYEPCSTGSVEWGCVKCKKLLADLVVNFFEPYRKKRKEILSDKDNLDKILKMGAEKARSRTSETMKLVRKRMKLLDI